QELLRLAGGLLTFSRSHTLADLPSYQHEQPEACFERPFEIVRALLDTVISARYFKIALTDVKPSIHLGRLDSQPIDEQSASHCGVSAARPASELVQSVPVRFTVAAPDEVAKCVLAAWPGVKLAPTARVPGAIPVRPGAQYFAIEAR